MDIDVNERLKQLQNLDNFISDSKDKVQSVLECLGWNTKETLTNNPLYKCTVNPSHRVPDSVLDAHTEKCSLRHEGYDSDDNFLSEPTNAQISSIYIGNDMKAEVLSAARQKIRRFKSAWKARDSDPQTSDRLLATFSSDERLALYDYAVQNTTGPSELPEYNILHPVSDEITVLTEEDTLRKERDSKRRRIKHKSVHTSHKNYTEVMREVIHGQMDLFSEWLSNKIEVGSSREDVATNVVAAEEVSINYADSVSKHSNHSQSSSIPKSDGDKYSIRDNAYPENSYKHEAHDHSHKNGKPRYHDSHDRSKGSFKRNRSRSRSSGRYRHRKRHRSRSNSRKKYSRHRR